MKDAILEIFKKWSDGQDDTKRFTDGLRHNDAAKEIASMVQKYHEWIFSTDCKFIFFHDHEWIFSTDCKFIFFHDGWWVTIVEAKESDELKSHDELFHYWYDEIYKKERK